MKKSEKEAIRALPTDELKAKLKEENRRLASLNFAHAVSPIENPMSIRAVRRYVAFLNSELQARTDADLKAKIESGELNRFNAREFVKNNHYQMPTPVSLSKVRKLIGMAGK